MQLIKPLVAQKFYDMNTCWIQQNPRAKNQLNSSYQKSSKKTKNLLKLIIYNSTYIHITQKGDKFKI